MTSHGFFLHSVQIDNCWLRWRRANRDLRWDFEPHHENPQRLLRTVCDGMLYSRTEVSEIIRFHSMRVVGVLQNAATLKNEVNFLFPIVENALATSIGI